MTSSALTLAIYGLLILIGGIIGHIQAKSTISLVMGLIFGVMIMGSAFALYQKKRASIWISLSLVLLLDAFFSYRFFKTLKFMPSGLMMLLSLATLLVLVKQLRSSKNR